MEKITLTCALYLAWSTSFCLADLSDIGPFIGDASDDFESYPAFTGGFSTLGIFGGDVTLNQLSQGAIKIELSSTLIFQGQTDTVLPRSPQQIMGQLGPMEWIFNKPVSRLGGYIDNNSFEDHVNFDFFDANGNLIESTVATTFWASDVWTWNGWESDVPIHRAVSAGNNDILLNGFIWYDDWEVSFATIPEPTGTTALLFCLAIGAFRRRQRKISRWGASSNNRTN